MRSAAGFILVLAACSRSSPEVTTKQPSAKVAVAIDAAVVDALVDATAPIEAVNPVATCGPGWRGVSATLRQLTADDRSATLCSSTFWPDSTTHTVKESAVRCARLDLATGVFAEEPVGTPAPRARAVSLSDLKLDVPAADAIALADTDHPVDLDSSGLRAVVALPRENTVAIFDTATGKRIRTLVVTAPGATCASAAFFIGDLVYASAASCKDPETERRAWLFAGDRKTATKPLRSGHTARTKLAGSLWAVASLRPYRVDFIDTATGRVTWSVPLRANDYDPMREYCCLALGASATGILMHDVSPLARVGTGSSIVAASSNAITWIDPVARTTKVLAFPPCK